jgi:hypothetical protein
MLLCDICNAGWNMACLLPPLTHPCWDIEMSLVHPSCPLIPGSTTTPQLPLPRPRP